MKTLFLFLIIFARCLISSAINVPFESPPFDPHAFIVNQKGNFIGLIGAETNDPFGSTYNIGFTNIQGTNYFFIYGTLTNNTTGSAASATNSPDGTSLNLMVTNVVYTNAGPAWLIVNKTSFLNTNNFSGGGGGGSGTLTNGVYTNAGPDTVVVSSSGTLALNTNKFAAPVDSRAWTNLNNGVSKFNGTVQMGKLTSDGGGIHSDGSGGLQVGTLTSLLTLAAGGGGFTVDSSGNETALNHTGSGAGLTTLNASALSSGTAPVARLPVGTSSSLGVLQPDGTSITVSGGVISAPGAGGGTVISVALADGSSSPIYTISGSPVTTTGTLTFSLANEAALSVFGNFSGSPAQPTFSTSPTFNGGNISSLNASHLTTGTVPAAQMPAFTGDITTSAGTVATTLKNTGTAGTYTKTTFDAQGRETSGTAAVLASSDYANQGQVHQVLHGNAAGNPSFSAVDLANDVTGNLSVNNLNGGSSASSSTFWRGDGTWAAATGASGITALSGDVTATGPGSAAATTVGINGTTLSGLASGLLYITTGTGVPTTKATWPNVAAVLTSLIPQSALGTGSGGTGTKFLADDQTYKTVSGGGTGITNLVATNAVTPFLGGPNKQTGFVARQYASGAIMPGYFRTYSGGAALANIRSAWFSLGDLNNDGMNDVVATQPSVSTFQVITNNGFGSFPNDQSFNLPNNKGTQGHAGLVDVNGDGSLDIIMCQGNTGGSNAVFVMTNNGTATAFNQLGSTYTIGTSSSSFAFDLATGDFNNDGHPDFVIEGSVLAVWTNDATGLFALAWQTPMTPTSTTSSQNVAVGDFNGDGLLDIAVVDFTSSVASVKIYTNSGASQFGIYYTKNIVPTSDSSPGIAVADVNGDGKADYVVYAGLAANHTVYTYTNTGNTATGFAPACTNVMTANLIRGLGTADVNMDGYPDLEVIQDTVFTTTVLTNNGLGNFVAYNTNSPGSVNAGVVGDFTGDGRPDLFLGNSGGPSFVMQNLCSILGIFQGDSGAVSNQLTLTSGNSSTFTPGVFNSGLTPNATLQLNTNFVPYVATFAPVALIGNGLGVTNISFCTTSTATSGTVTSANTHQIETTYMNSGSTIVSMTWALPTSTTLGKIFYLHSKSAITTLTITGGSFIDTAVVAMTAGQTIGFETIDGAGTYIRMQ